MNKNLSKLLANPFFSGSLVMILGSNFVNGLNYLYHLIMGRFLGPSSYGELSALLSLMNLLGIIPLSFGLVVIKFISSANKKDETQGLINWFSKKVLFLSFLIFLLMVLFSGNISQFLNMQNSSLVILVGASFLVGLPTFLNRSILQGLLKFKETILTLVLESGLKLLLGVLLVYLGFSVFGAMIGMLIATSVTWFLSQQYLVEYSSKSNSAKVDKKAILLFMLPVLGHSFANTSLISTDLILVKHFFSAHDAGVYSAISTLGKIIFFATAPIAAVMFPLIAKRKASGQNYHNIFLNSLGLTTTICLIAVLGYFLLPSLSVNILFGPLYLEAAKHLGLFGIFVALYSTSAVFINFFLSLGHNKIAIFPVSAALIQALGIWVYHNSVDQVIWVSIIVNVILLISLFTYYLNFRLKSD